MFERKSKDENIQKCKDLQKVIKYSFKDLSIMKAALTHKSYVGLFNITKHVYDKNNERLEFLGDSVLGFVVTDYVYKKYKNLKEGELSEIKASLVCKSALSNVAKGMDLYKFLIHGKGITQEEIKVNDSFLENTVEALVGAIFLDGGLKPAKKFIFKFIIPPEDKIKINSIKDGKSRLQEILQENGEVKIEYRLVNTTGPDHDKSFEVEVYCNGKLLGRGQGKNKKHAEQEAAQEALLKIKDKSAI